MTIHAWIRIMRRRRFLILLLLLISALIMQSMEWHLPGTSVIANLLLTITFFVTILAVFTGTTSRRIALTAWVIAVALDVGQVLLQEATVIFWLEVSQRLFRMVFDGWAAALILGDIFRRGQIGTDDVFGAVCGYFLAAMAWGSLYTLFDLLVPGAFTISSGLLSHFAGPLERSGLFYYFSFVTITSVGFGDIAPLRGPMTVITTLETVFGQFYLAVVVAQLVGLRMTQCSRSPRGD